MIKKCFSDVYKKTNWSSWFFLILFDSSLNLSARKTNNPCILFCRLWYLTFVQFNIYKFFNTPSRTLSIGDLVVFFYNITIFIIPISFFYAYSTLIKFIHICLEKKDREWVTFFLLSTSMLYFELVCIFVRPIPVLKDIKSYSLVFTNWMY